MRQHGPRSRALLRLDRLAVVVAFSILGALTLIAPLFVGISGMRTTGCTTTCTTSLVGAGGAVIVGGCIRVTVIAFAALLAVPRSDRYLWWLPTSALAIAVALLLIGNHLIDLGVGA